MKSLFSFLFLIFSLISKVNFAQKQGQEKIDSLKLFISEFKSPCNVPCIFDSSKVNALCFLAWEYHTLNPDTALKIFDQAYQLAKKISWNPGIALALHVGGQINFQKGNYEQALSLANYALRIWDSALSQSPPGYKSFLLMRKSNTLANIGMVYTNTGKNYTAIDFQLKALENFELLHDSLRMGRQLNNISVSYKNLGDLSNQLKYSLMALKFFELLKDEKQVMTVLANIGLVYRSMNDFKNAFSYYNKAYQLAEKYDNKMLMANALLNKGAAYSYLDENKLALLCFYSSLSLNKEIDNTIGIIQNLGNIGTVYNDSADILIQKKEPERAKQFYDTALVYYFSALKMEEEVGTRTYKVINLGNIGLAYSSLRQYGKAEKYLEEALALSVEIESPDDIRFNNEQLSELFIKKGNYKKALEYFKNAVVAKDTFFNEEKIQEITRLEEQYKFDKKEAITKAGQEKKDAIAKQELEKQKVIRNSIAGGAGIIALSSLFSFFFYKRKRDAEQKQREISLSLQVSETEMKALRSQMNPHFIFNALQSIQTFLLSHQSDEANNYLLKFSKLMRLVLENSQHSEVSLKEDMQALELYMQLKSIRLPHPFTYKLHIDESVNMENDSIPALILQPFVENSIWHGLQYKTEPGKIDIYISKKDNAIYATVEDNGVGRDMSKQVSQPLLHKKESLGMKLTEERLKILNELKKIKAQFKIVDLFTKENKPAGTKVELSLPLVT